MQGLSGRRNTRSTFGRSASASIRRFSRSHRRRCGKRSAPATDRELRPDSGLLMRPRRVVIAAPDAFHPELAVAALNAGLHVMCEKPLALTGGLRPDRGGARPCGRVVQVAYMKRYDPAYRRALDFLPAEIDDVKLISVEVNDPDQAPFVAHLPMIAPDDIPARASRRHARQDRARNSETAGRDDRRRRMPGRSAAVSSLRSSTTLRWSTACRPFRRRNPATADHGAIFDEAAACNWLSACRAAVASA